jgi:choline dehydrogenase-like flavoprotein
VTAERVDVAIVGSGFGGAIAAWRLAELYAAAGEDPARILVLERGRRHRHVDFKQSMHIDHLSDVYRLIQGQGAQVVVANGVGGGSTLYLAASLRAPTGVFERPEWPGSITRAALDPYYRRAELALRVRRPRWDEVSKSGGLWAATLAAAGYTCDRVPVAISRERCVNAKWCHTGCIFGAKNTVTTNYLASAERLGVRVLPEAEVQLVRQTQARPYRYSLTAGGREVDCRALVLACGAMGTAPLLMRSRPFLPALSPRLGRHLGVNGDHVAAIEYDERRVRDLLGLPGYADFQKGMPITTMTHDFWADRSAGGRFTLQEIFLSTLTNFLYDDGRAPEGEPSWWGIQKKQAIANWSRRIEILAMVEDSNDGEFLAGHLRPNDGPLAVGLFRYEMSERSRAVREAADAAIRRIAERRGLGRFMRLSETSGAYAAHPLGGCRMGEDADGGVVDDTGAVHGYEALYCMDSSIVPTPLGVNPSLTVAALAERCAEALVRRGADLGLPSAPPGFAPGVPDEIVGERVVPG